MGFKMTQSSDDSLDLIIRKYDEINLEDDYNRRWAVKPLYDFFMRIILEVGVRLCEQHRNTYKNLALKTRWDIIKNCLSIVEEPSQWDQVIYTLQKERVRVEHNDYYIPDETVLGSIRENAFEFKDWVIENGKKYFRMSEGFSFLQKFNGIVRVYISRADYILGTFGNSLPTFAENDFVPYGEEHPYLRLSEVRDFLQKRVFEIKSIDDLQKEDLENLVTMITQTERLDVKETSYLERNICPKCGSNIIDTEKAYGGSIDDPIPTTIVYRVGCENCDYEVHVENIEI